jgi:hypothetical protein
MPDHFPFLLNNTNKSDPDLASKGLLFSRSISALFWSWLGTAPQNPMLYHHVVG